MPRRSNEIAIEYLDYSDSDDDEYTPAGSQSSSVAHPVPTRKNPARSVKVVIADDVREAKTAGYLLHPLTLSSEYKPFLEKIQAVSNARGRQFDICTQVICWKDSKERQKYQKFMIEGQLTDETTITGWLNTARAGPRIRVGFISSFVTNPVKEATRLAEWGAKNWHVWVLMVIHAADGHNGRAIAVYDCNARQFAAGTRWRCFNNGRAKTLVEKAIDGAKGVPIFVSNPSKVPNDDGICVRLTVDRLLKLVEEGLVIRRDARGTVIGIDDFTYMRP